MRHWLKARPAVVLLAITVGIFAVACSEDEPTETPTAAATVATTATVVATGTPAEDPGTLIVYSGRSESLIGPLLDEFEAETGIDVRVRYGGTPAIAAAILEEGENTPADIYIGQDAGSVGRLSLDGFFAELPQEVLDLVPAQYRSQTGDWVGLSGRVRVVVYNTEIHSEDTLPASILDYANPEWAGKVGWAPTNASFQSFVTALRVSQGEDVAREWLQAMVDNGTMVYPGNGDIVQAVANGEVEVGFVNHYYLNGFLVDQGEGFKARNYYFTNGDIGGLMNVAGAGVLNTASNPEAAIALIEFMLRDSSQAFFAQETTEFPLIVGAAPPVDHVPPIESLAPIDVDLTDLGDLDATLAMLQEVGALP